MLKLGMKSQMK